MSFLSMNILRRIGSIRLIFLLSVLSFCWVQPALGAPFLERESLLEKEALEKKDEERHAPNSATNPEWVPIESEQAFQLLPLTQATVTDLQRPDAAFVRVLSQPSGPPGRPSHRRRPNSPPRQPRSSVQQPTIEPPTQSGENSPGMLSQQSTRINARVPIVNPDSVLEVRSRSEVPHSPSVFIVENRKESFELLLRQVINRSPQSEFSLTFGFAHRDEALPSRPPGPPPGPSRLPTEAPRNRPLPPTASQRPAAFQQPPTPQQQNSSNRRLRPPMASPPNASDASILPPNGPTAGPLSPSPASSGIRTGTLLFSQNYRQKDASGRWLVRSQFSVGAELASTPPQQNSDSQFISWVGLLERTQDLNNNNNLTLRLETQLTPSHMSGPHQFKMKTRGFEQFERDERPAEISGDNGVHLHLENQMVLVHRQETQSPLLTLVPFVGLGYAWGQGNPNRPNQQFLGRTGIGLSVQPVTGLDIGLNYLVNWGDLQPDADTQNAYATVGYQAQW